MDPHEEQQQELEVLASIYPDELEKSDDSHFSIKIALDTASDRKYKLILDVKYPKEYPEVIPELRIEVSDEDVEEVEEEYEDEDEDEDENSNRILNLSSTIEFLKDDMNMLLDKLIEEANMQIGMPVVFSLTTLLKDEAELLYQKKLNDEQKRYDEELMKKEMEEQKKFHGTKVTKESWNKWREAFRNEMKLEERDLERFNEIHQGKFTGREVFEKGLAGNDEDLINEIGDNVKKLVI